MSNNNGLKRCQRAYDGMEDPYYWDNSEEETEETKQPRDTSKITIKLLEELNACEEGIAFFKRNFKEPLDLNTTKIEGDFCSYFTWFCGKTDRMHFTKKTISFLPYAPIRRKILFTLNINEKNQVESSYDYIGGGTTTYEYDERGNMVMRKSERIQVNGHWFATDVNFEYDHDDQDRLTEMRVGGKTCLKITYGETQV